MKITKTEKGIIIIIVAIVCFMGFTVVYISNRIAEEGGLKAVIIEAGKEAKDIGREIAEH